MAKFLNTSATNYYLEEMIKNAREKLILISPFLKLNDRMKELLEDKNRLKIDVRIIYGKSELHPDEINWLKGQDFIRTSFCKNLHAKCYLNEQQCIISSLNLYEFSQVNNNEMGVLLSRDEDNQVYMDAFNEAQRIIRISDEVRISLEKIPETKIESNTTQDTSDSNKYEKLTTPKLAEKLGISKEEMLDRLVAKGYLELKGTTHFMTDKAKEIGGETRKGKFGYFQIWDPKFFE